MIWENLFNIMSKIEALKKRGARLLDPYRPTERVRSVDEIDFQKYAQRGVRAVLFDGEGTVVPTDGWEVSLSARQRIESSGITNIGIVTHKKADNPTAFTQVSFWGHQIGAEVVLIPSHKGERKPNPALVKRGIAHFDLQPNQVLVVGDKLTADVKAGNTAGTYTIKVERHGRADLIGDRLIRRPLERVIEWGLDKTKQPVPDQKPTPQQVLHVHYEENQQQQQPDWLAQVDPVVVAKSRIANIGEGPIVPSTVPKSELAIADKKFGRVARFKKWYKELMSEKGRTVADTLTDIRKKAGYVEVPLILLGFKRLEQIVDLAVSATDLGDGHAARLHKDGATTEGAYEDQTVDKKRALLRTAAKVAVGKIRFRHLVIRVASDQFVNKVMRPFFAKRGVDVKAGVAGKISTGVESASLFSASTEKNPENIQYAADIAKVGRAAIYGVQWFGRLLKNRRDEKSRAKAEAEMLAA
jgi:HAD superfamily phosphatase (TIGR01668 family)